MSTRETTRGAHQFFQRRSLLLKLIALLVGFLLLVLAGVLFGPGLDPATGQVIWIPIAASALVALTAALIWMLLKRPPVLRIDDRGVYLPMTFKKPLAWSDIHRITRSRSKAGMYGTRDWIIIDPSPGMLAPLRLPVWRWFELKFQKFHGVRIPLHGIDGPPEDIVASIERFRPVQDDAS